MQDPLGAALEAKEHIGVVVEEASLDKGRDVGREFLDAQTGDVFGEIFGMGADVADAAGGAGALGIGAPGGLFLAGFLDARGQPALRILHDDLAEFAEASGADDFAGFLDERVAGVVVREPVEQAGAGNDVPQLKGFREVECGRLVRKNRESMLQSGFGSGEMNMVRSDDGDEIHPLADRQRGFGFHHLFK